MAKSDLEKAGEDTEGMIDSTSKLQEKIKGLSGFDIMASPSEFKSTYDIMAGLSAAYKDMSDIDRASLLETIAGTLFCQNMWKHILRIFLTAGNPLEPYTTIVEKSHYECFTT